MIDLRAQTVGHFLDELASGAATPGGGAAAGLSGAMGAALMSMVANLTVGRKKFAEVEGEMVALRDQAEAIRSEMTALAQLDAAVFDKVMAAYRLPKETEGQATAREANIQRALEEATQVPLKTMEEAAKLFEIAAPLAAKGNPNAISDVGAGLLLADAALRAALLNVRINLALLTDESFASRVRARVSELMANKDEQRRAVLEMVQAKM